MVAAKMEEELPPFVILTSIKLQRQNMFLKTVNSIKLSLVVHNIKRQRAETEDGVTFSRR
jgi:hypothetical protein